MYETIFNLTGMSQPTRQVMLKPYGGGIVVYLGLWVSGWAVRNRLPTLSTVHLWLGSFCRKSWATVLATYPTVVFQKLYRLLVSKVPTNMAERTCEL
jgi:hypothetical protein